MTPADSNAASPTPSPAMSKFFHRVQAAGIIDGSCTAATGFGEVLTEVLMLLGMIYTAPDLDYRDSLPAIFCTAAPSIVQGALKVAKAAASGSATKKVEVTVSFAELEALFGLITEVCKVSNTVYIAHKSYVGAAELLSKSKSGAREFDDVVSLPGDGAPPAPPE